MALCTAAEVRDLLQLTSETALNTLLDTYATRASVALAQWCGYPPGSSITSPSMESVTYTRYSGDYGLRLSRDRRSLWLEPWPVTSITSVYDDPNEVYGADTLVAAADYGLRGDRGEELRLEPTATHGAFSTTERAVKIVYVAGYASVPADLALAAAELVAHWYNLRGRRGLSSEGQPDIQTSYRGEEIPLVVRQLANPYRLPSVYL